MVAEAVLRPVLRYPVLIMATAHFLCSHVGREDKQASSHLHRYVPAAGAACDKAREAQSGFTFIGVDEESDNARPYKVTIAALSTPTKTIPLVNILFLPGFSESGPAHFEA